MKGSVMERVADQRVYEIDVRTTLDEEIDNLSMPKSRRPHER
jgi:hypothetical protein